MTDCTKDPQTEPRDPHRVVAEEIVRTVAAHFDPTCAHCLGLVEDVATILEREAAR